jgi:ferrochelatase
VTDAALGVLLVNLGSPAAPTTPAVRAYLREFLSDPRVVDLPRPLWLPLLHLLVLPRRAPRSAALYRRIWGPEGSPLVAHTRAQARALGEHLPAGTRVEVAMRYGTPSLASGLTALLDAGVEALVIVPMFPQAAEATTGSVRAAVLDCLLRLPRQVPTRIVPSFPTHPGYLDALAARCRESVAVGPVDHHVFSFHGLPERVVARGDPYRAECEATAAALAGRLGLRADDWTLVFQSRFGPQAWLQPYADRAVPALAARAPRVAIATPGFTADCLETIDEIGVLLAERFAAAGGQELRRVPCLDEHPLWIEALADLVRNHPPDPEAPASTPRLR